MNDPALKAARLDQPEGLGAEALRVYAWRFEELERAGFAEEHARTLAEDRLVDLHAACQLVALGCAQETAYRILS